MTHALQTALLARASRVICALSLLAGSAACEPPPTAPEAPPTPDWAHICGRHCAGHPLQVSIGGVHTCVRYPGGAVLCWGFIRGVADDTDTDPTYGLHYQSMDPNSPKRSIRLATGILDATDLATGLDWSCVVRGGRGLWCWGSDLTGHTQLGGSTYRISRPAPGHMIPAPAHYGEDVHRVWAHDESKCTDKPQRIVFDGPLHQVDDCAPGHCIIDDGKVWCWDDNDGSARDFSDPVQRCDSDPTGQPAVGIDDAVQIASLTGVACALRATGEVWCWGGNNTGMVGREPRVGPYDDCDLWNALIEPFPVKVEGLEDIVQIGISQGRGIVCALRADHQLLCWGEDDVLAMRTAEPRPWVPRPYPGASDVVSFDLRAGLCVIRESGEVACDRDFPPFTDQPPGWRFGDLVPIRDLPDLPEDFPYEPGDAPGPDAGTSSDGGTP